SGLACSIDVDIDGGPGVFAVEVVTLDPRSGRVIARPAAHPASLTFPEEGQWREAITDLRARLESPS
ncbi:MAG: hypothetical protein ACRDGK_02420, partial [Actinomycetota bacterium]